MSPRAQAERLLLVWFTTVAQHEIPELARLARTLDSWREELLAYFDIGGVSNRPTEAINGLIKKIKWVGHGYATSPTTGYGCCCTAASTGRLPPSPRSKGGYHVLLLRARKSIKVNRADPSRRRHRHLLHRCDQPALAAGRPHAARAARRARDRRLPDAVFPRARAGVGHRRRARSARPRPQ